MNKRYLIALMVVIFSFGIYWGSCVIPKLEASQKLTWTYEQCYTLEAANAFLNKLSEDRAIEAKFVVLNSNRNIGGLFGCPYVIYYRR